MEAAISRISPCSISQSRSEEEDPLGSRPSRVGGELVCQWGRCSSASRNRTAEKPNGEFEDIRWRTSGKIAPNETSGECRSANLSMNSEALRRPIESQKVYLYQVLMRGGARATVIQHSPFEFRSLSLSRCGQDKNKCRGSAGTSGPGPVRRQVLTRPRPGLRDTSPVTCAEIRPGTHAPCVGRVTVQAGFLTRGSLSCLRLPGQQPSGTLEEDSPLTVAGAAPGLTAGKSRRTGFPC